MGADVLVTQGAMASATMILPVLNQNYSVPIHQGLTDWDLNEMIETWARFLCLALSKLRLCSANHRSNLPCDWLSTAWAYSKQDTENGPWTKVSDKFEFLYNFTDNCPSALVDERGTRAFWEFCSWAPEKMRSLNCVVDNFTQKLSKWYLLQLKFDLKKQQHRN